MNVIDIDPGFKRDCDIAAKAYDQGFIAGERAGNLHRDRAFDAGVGVGAICGFALGVVFTVFLGPVIAGLLS
jgi:tetrahydromethanopterin S-methyltransferase subunit F